MKNDILDATRDDILDVTIKFGAKCSDMSWIDIVGCDGTIYEKEGYAPDIKGLCGGDYIDMEIDNRTGKILNWKPINTDKFTELQQEDD